MAAVKEDHVSTDAPTPQHGVSYRQPAYDVDKTTTERLNALLAQKVAEGWSLRELVHLGSRDWVVICENAPWPAAHELDHEQLEQPAVDVLTTDANADYHRGDDTLMPPVGYERPYADAAVKLTVYGPIQLGQYEYDSRWQGWLEDTARTWIVFLAKDGRPSLYWPTRTASGAVFGQPIELS
jgi:hypothetical protein